MNYNPALDGLRAVAIATVLGFHCTIPGFGGGHVGVDLFFVLSGYLITALLVEEQRQGGIDVGRFYLRRLLRLYPALLILVVVYLAVAPTLLPKEPHALMATLAATYTMDYGLAFQRLPPTIGHTWSLGVEEKFYLLWPLLLPLLLRARRPLVWLLGAFAVTTAWRYAVAGQWGWLQAYFSFDTRVSGIVLGAVAALRPTMMPRWLVKVAVVALVINIAAPSLPFHWLIAGITWRTTLAELCAFVLVSHVAAHPQSPWLASGPMVWFGRLSYGIYLWHFPPISWVGRDAAPWLKVVVAVPFSLAMAMLCLALVDKPISRLRKQLHRPAGEARLSVGT